MKPFSGAASDTGWTALTHEGSAGTLRYRVLDGVVYVEAAITIALTNNTVTDVLTSGHAIPSPHRPSLAVTTIGSVDVGTFSCRVNRLTDGTITARQNTGSTAATLSFAYSYPLG